MIKYETLKRRITKEKAWPAIVKVFDMDISPENLANTADRHIILKAFSEGSINSPSLRSKLHQYPFPEIARLGSYSDPSLVYHLSKGIESAIAITEKAEKFGSAVKDVSAVLDFGCGTSRILRYMLEFQKGPRYFGSEVFEDNITWGRSAFPQITYILQSTQPPLDLPSRAFDIIYAYSIFTHFEEQTHLRWLAELHRLLASGGLLILTVHGKSILHRCRNEEVFKANGNDGEFPFMCKVIEDYEELCRQFHTYGFTFYSCYDPDRLIKGGLDPYTFGIAYISPDYMRDNWSSMFNILEIDEGAISNWQDYVVLKKH